MTDGGAKMTESTEDPEDPECAESRESDENPEDSDVLACNGNGGGVGDNEDARRVSKSCSKRGRAEGGQMVCAGLLSGVPCQRRLPRACVDGFGVACTSSTISTSSDSASDSDGISTCLVLSFVRTPSRSRLMLKQRCVGRIDSFDAL